MSDYMPIGHAPHLVYVVVWVENGDTRSTESPLLAANMASDPPELLPVVWTSVPEDAPVRKLLHDERAKVWFDLETGERLTDWKKVVAPLFDIWDARNPQLAPQAAPKLPPPQVPSHYPEPTPPHRRKVDDYRSDAPKDSDFQ